MIDATIFSWQAVSSHIKLRNPQNSADLSTAETRHLNPVFM